MSGSYDRPTGRPTLQPTQTQPQAAYDEHTGGDHVPHRDSAHAEPRAAARAAGAAKRHACAPRRARAQTNAPIVPAGSVTGRSLTLVITIMCFLACLTAGAVYMMNQSASAWLRDIASEVTVQVEARENVPTSTRWSPT